jgi:hypothetical protein
LIVRFEDGPTVRFDNAAGLGFDDLTIKPIRRTGPG